MRGCCGRQSGIHTPMEKSNTPHRKLNPTRNHKPVCSWHGSRWGWTVLSW